MLSRQVSIVDHTQPTAVLSNDKPSKRLLRTAKSVNVGEEERVLEALMNLLLKLPKDFLNWLLYTNAKLPKEHVADLLAKNKLRESTFQYWARADIDAARLKSALGRDANSKQLLRMNERFLG